MDVSSHTCCLRHKVFIYWLAMAVILLMPGLGGYQAHAQFAGGTGTAQNPFIITNITQLQAIRQASNSAHFRLGNDIDASATSEWNGGTGFNPISWFNGSLDGNGYTISGLHINRPGTNDMALFVSSGSEALFQNIVFTTANINGSLRVAALVGTLAGTASNITVSGTISGVSLMGAVAGQLNGGSITNCQVNATINGSGSTNGLLVGFNNQGTISGCNVTGTVSGQGTLGGLVGNNQGVIEDCHADVTVNGTEQYVGGLVGFNNQWSINNSSSSGTVNGTTDVGGLVGRNGSITATISNSHSSASVNGETNVGGLVGLNNDGTIEKTSSTGEVTGTTNIGGLVGFSGWSSSAVIRLSYSTSPVSPSPGGGNRNQFGGLVGRLHGGIVDNCFARGDVNGNNRVGGLVGEMTNDASVINSFSTGAVNSDAGQAGGLAGRSQGASSSNSFWDTQTSGWTTSDEGAGRNTVQMKTQSTFVNAGWDFNNIWVMDPAVNDGYPYLRAFYTPQPFTWTGNIDTAWEKAGNWSTNAIPPSGQNIIIPNVPNKPVISSAVVINGITINPNSRLTVGPKGSLTVNNTLVNQAGNSGFIIASTSQGTGSFIYHGGVAGSFERYIANKETWQMLSSPVQNQSITGDFAPMGVSADSYGDGTRFDFYLWHEPDTSWIYLLHQNAWNAANGNGNFVVGRGYLVSYLDPNTTKTFTGSLNHGNISIPVTKTSGEGDYFGNNLSGNPYPSSIDWKASSGWDRSVLESNGSGYDIWIWNESEENYGVYNSGSGSDEGTLGVTRYIAPNQGFFVRASETGTISMNDTVRVHQGADNWIKGYPSVYGAPGLYRMRLRVDEDNGPRADEVIMEFGHHNDMGSPKLFSFLESAPSLYLPSYNQDYSIRLMQSFDTNPVVPLSFTAGREGQYTLKLGFAFQDLDMALLEDLQSGTSHDFTTGSDYTFFAHPKDKPGRFIIRFKEGNFANPHDKLPVLAYTSGNRLTADLQLVDPSLLCQIKVIDMLGRITYEQQLAGGSKYEVTLDRLQGAYMVQISTKDASYSTKVMIF